MTNTDLIATLTAMGFVATGTGGNCMAMTYYADGKSIVVTDAEGLSLPSASDWGIGVYKGDFLQDEDAECIDAIDSECSPVDLMTAINISKGN